MLSASYTVVMTMLSVITTSMPYRLVYVVSKMGINIQSDYYDLDIWH